GAARDRAWGALGGVIERFERRQQRLEPVLARGLLREQLWDARQPERERLAAELDLPLDERLERGVALGVEQALLPNAPTHATGLEKALGQGLSQAVQLAEGRVQRADAGLDALGLFRGAQGRARAAGAR